MEMFKRSNGRPSGCSFTLLALPGMLGWALFAATTSHAASLSLEAAEALALRQDPSVQAVEARREALQELAVASGQLPDPMLRAGLVSLPTDTWRLGQEPMTQVQIGLSQKFPRGHTRSLQSEQLQERSRSLNETIRDRRLRIALAVREGYIEVLKQVRRAEINAGAVVAFADLADITQDYYATGRVQQQDVLQAVVELAKVEDRATRIAQEEDRARASLATWIGEAAWGEVQSDWPALDAPSTLDEITRTLLGHPRIAALQRQISAAETGVELAKQRYKPEFGVDLVYGQRSGSDMDGASRPDLFTVMVVMDLPLFHKNRQDRYAAASVAESSAALFERDDMYRRMLSEAQLNMVTLQRQQERMRQYEHSLLPEAGFNAEASLEAYQSALDNLTTVMRARITEYELQLDFADLQAELLKTRARLSYLAGEQG
jgi:outer membrane protein TolC